MRKTLPPGACFYLATLLLYGCASSEPAVHVHDRHSSSFLPIYAEARRSGPLTLLLLDYHHDCGPGPDEAALDRFVADARAGSPAEPLAYGITSYNWVGALVLTGAIERVIWVSGKDLLLPNIEARRAWLRERTSHEPPDSQERKLGAVEVWTWEHFLRDRASLDEQALAVTLDLDILTVDPGENPDAFLAEMTSFLRRISPRIETLALSAAYHGDPEAAWRWFSRAYSSLYCAGRTFLELGPAEAEAESIEERQAWQRWAERPLSPDLGSSFAPALELWSHAPEAVGRVLAGSEPAAGDATAPVLLDRLGSGSSAVAELRARWRPAAFRRWADIVRSVVRLEIDHPSSEYDGSYPASPAHHQGIAVRFVSGPQDRGCLAFYDGVADMESAVALAALGAAFNDPRYEPLRPEELDALRIEITVFGELIPMEEPLAFDLAADALLLEGPTARALLQSSVAQERGLSQTQFLETLTRKAGLEPGGWRSTELRFSRAPALSYSFPFSK